MRKMHFPEKKIMSISMIAVCTFLLVMGTVAWFTMNDPVRLTQLHLRTDGIEALYVDVKILPYQVDLNQEETVYSDMMSNAELRDSGFAQQAEDGVHYNITRMSLGLAGSTEDVDIDMGQQELNSIEENKLGPGAYGQVVFYIKSMNALGISYRLHIQPELTFTENYAMDDELKEELRELAADHIRFYGTREDAGVNSFTYGSRIRYEGAENSSPGIAGSLTPGVEQEVVAYWCWPYEYQYIPRDTEDVSAPVSTTSHDMESYDLGDTKIGNYIPEIKFHFAVTGD